MNAQEQPQTKKLNEFFAGQPLTAAVILGTLTLTLQYLPRFLLPELEGINQKFIGKIIISIFAIILLSTLGWWREAFFVPPSKWKMWVPFLPLLLLPILSALVSDFNVSDPVQIAFFALYTLVVGFAEEAIVRGLMLRTLRPKGLMQAVFLSSLIFGLMHLANLMMGTDLGSTITQVIYATLIGIAFAGTLEAGGSIWPLIIIHALVDFFPQLSAVPDSASSVNFASALILIGVQIPFALYGWWMLRRHMRKTQG